MGKTKNKNHRPDEFQKEQIRHLKKEIRRKDQTIRQLEKELGYKDKIVIPKTVKEPVKCPDCGKGHMDLIDIGIRLYAICTLCKFRERIS